jgi:arginyl-tRNA synthetase
MNEIKDIITASVKGALEKLYNIRVDKLYISLLPTRKEFRGDFTIVVFPLLSYSKKKPEETAKEIGEFLIKDLNEIESFNVIKGFLNLSISK